MNNLPSQLNPGTDAIYRAFRAGVAAERVGSVNTSILLFSGPGEGSPELPITGDAVTGSEVVVYRTGLYVVSLRIQNAAATLVAGVSLNTDEAGLTALPSYAVEGMQDLQSTNGPDVQGNAAPLTLDAFVAVRGPDLGDDGTARIRAHARTTADASPDGIVVGAGSLLVRRISPVF